MVLHKVTNTKFSIQFLQLTSLQHNICTEHVQLTMESSIMVAYPLFSCLFCRLLNLSTQASAHSSCASSAILFTSLQILQCLTYTQQHQWTTVQSTHISDQLSKHTLNATTLQNKHVSCSCRLMVLTTTTHVQYYCNNSRTATSM